MLTQTTRRHRAPSAPRAARRPWQPAALLLAGDLAMLAVFVTAGSLSPPPGSPAAVAGALARDLALLGGTWLVVGGWLRALDLRQPVSGYVWRSLAAGGLTLLAGLLLRGLWVGRLPPLGSVLLLASDGVTWLMAWHLPVRLAYGLVRRVGWARLRPLALAGLAVVGLGAALLLAPRVYAVARFSRLVFPAAAVPPRPSALVFGAALWPDGRPSSVLENRVRTAADLYHAGKVSTLLLSGDGRSIYYDEPGAMRRLALDLGVPEAALVLDYAGLNTYASCYRAQAVFGEGEVMLVTQSFQLTRALFICEALGVDAVGVSADREVSALRSVLGWQAREVLATAAAAWDVYVARPVPALGRPVPAAD